MSSWQWYYNRLKSYVGRPRLLVQERIISVDEGDQCERPIFIVGAHRSGTSLVRRMFNSHPDIACPPETFFLSHFVDMLDDTKVLEGYSGFGFDEALMRKDLARKAASLHEAYRIGQGKRIWADKTPQYTRILDGLDRLFDRKPRYVLVLRHPCDIVNSIYKRGWRFNEIEDLFESTVSYVRESIDLLTRFEAEQPDRCSRLDYRLLCEDPAATLDATMRRIDLRFDPEMLNFADKNHNYGLEDPVVRGKKTVEASAGAWHGWSDAQKERAREVFGDRALTPVYWS